MSAVHRREPRRSAREIVAQYPQREVGDPAAAAPRAGPGRLASRPRRWTRSPSSSSVTPARCSGRAPSTRCSSASPCGKLLVSVCTNVTCLVNGGPELLEHLERRYADRRRRRPSKRSSASPRATLAPVLQVNYEFHGTASPDADAETIVEEYKRGHARGAHDLRDRGCGADAMARRDAHRHQVPARAPRRLVDDRRRARDRRVRRAARGARAWRPTDDPASRSRRRACAVAAAPASAPGRSGRSCPKDVFPRYLVGERRRRRAVHVQGPHARRARPAPADRGHRSSRRSRSSATTRSSTCAASSRSAYERLEQAIADAYAQGLHRQEHPRLGLRPRDRRAPRRRLRTSPATRPACSRASRASAAMPRIKPPFPAVAGPVREADGRQQRRDAVDGPAHHRDGRRGVRARSASNRSTGTRIFSVSGHVERPGQLRGRARHARSATSSTASPAASATARSSKFFIPGGASSPWLGIDEHLDAPLDMDYVQQRARARCSAPGRSWCSTRPSTRCSSRGGSPSSSRTSRAASARRAARARAGSRRCSTAWRTARPPRGPRPAARRSATTSRRASRRAVRADDDLPARAERGVADREPRQVLPRRDHRAHARDAERRRERRRARVTDRSDEPVAVEHGT